VLLYFVFHPVLKLNMVSKAWLQLEGILTIHQIIAAWDFPDDGTGSKLSDKLIAEVLTCLSNCVSSCLCPAQQIGWDFNQRNIIPGVV